MAATVDNEVDWGICITLATNKLNVAAAKIMITDFVVINSEGIIPFANVLETSPPNTTAPKTTKIINRSDADRLLIALLPQAVANDPANVGDPMLMAKKHEIKRIMLMAIDLNRVHRYLLETTITLADFLESYVRQHIHHGLIDFLPDRFKHM
jgi:hypothetical protein